MKIHNISKLENKTKITKPDFIIKQIILNFLAPTYIEVLDYLKDKYDVELYISGHSGFWSASFESDLERIFLKPTYKEAIETMILEIINLKNGK